MLPGNEMQGFAAALAPNGALVISNGTVVAIAGDYAGRAEQAVRAPFKPRLALRQMRLGVTSTAQPAISARAGDRLAG